MSHNIAILLLGTNLGDRKKNIDTAVSMLESNGCVVQKKTDYLFNEAVDFHTNNNFCNIATQIRTQLSPMKLLALAKEIEHSMGRMQDSFELGGYADRCIDIDIVLYNNLIFKSKKLGIPHERNFRERAFSRGLIEELMNLE